MDSWDRNINAAVNDINSFIQVCQNVFEPEQSSEIEKHFEDIVKRYSSIDNDHETVLQTIEQLHSYYENEENDQKQPVDQCYEQIRKKIPKKQIDNHKFLKKFRLNLEDSRMDDNINENVNGDDDLVSCTGFIIPTDPISKKEIRKPVRNVKCGHVYDKDSILALIKQSNTKCPYIGCPNMKHIQAHDLIEDDKLKMQIERYMFKRK